ncbi:flavodoxin family protein [Erysipelothrix larvae]|uniref:flavodoxin family protein n=1 Tax=Erysipelothrix larvae TaxID=1514105 RepID=UPI000A40D94C|nr:flavodoxin family protein [Erysipelothrix larvae]
MKTLFINGSPNKNGQTYYLTHLLLKNIEFETLMLPDYRISVYGQTLSGDQFSDVYNKMKEADTIVIGSPVYWHNICGSIRTLF